MRTRIFVLTGFILALSVAAAYATEPCDGLPYGEARDCVKAELQKADAQLNKLYKELQAQIRVAYKDDKIIAADSVKQMLVQAQRKWIEFRDGECGFQSEQAQGGTGTLEPFVHSKCLLKMTRERVEAFQGYIADLKKLQGTK